MLVAFLLFFILFCLCYFFFYHDPFLFSCSPFLALILFLFSFGLNSYRQLISNIHLHIFRFTIFFLISFSVLHSNFPAIQFVVFLLFFFFCDTFYKSISICLCAAFQAPKTVHFAISIDYAFLSPPPPARLIHIILGYSGARYLSLSLSACILDSYSKQVL